MCKLSSVLILLNMINIPMLKLLIQANFIAGILKYF